MLGWSVCAFKSFLEGIIFILLAHAHTLTWTQLFVLWIKTLHMKRFFLLIKPHLNRNHETWVIWSGIRDASHISDPAGIKYSSTTQNVNESPYHQLDPLPNQPNPPLACSLSLHQVWWITFYIIQCLKNKQITVDHVFCSSIITLFVYWTQGFLLVMEYFTLNFHFCMLSK